MKAVFTGIAWLFILHAGAQSFVFGRIENDSGKAVSGVKVSNSASGKHVFSDSAGKYRIEFVYKKRNVLKFEKTGYKPVSLSVPFLYEDEDYRQDVSMSSTTMTFNPSRVTAERVSQGVIELKPLDTRPSVSGDFMDLIKTLPGVQSNNELSSQYNVRGGSYDENLIYVNDIEIYRPQLIRSGQQEGLSFVNPDLVNNVDFSAGGFEARYGDKLSSVLDVQYRRPRDMRTGIQAGLLGASFFTEGIAKAGKRIGFRDSVRLTYLLGARYRGNRNLLNTLDAQGLYKSRFADFQSLITWHFNRFNRLEILCNLAVNRFRFEPEYQETTFGTLQSALRLRIGLDGQEIMDYSSAMGAISYVFSRRSTELKFMASGFVSGESEHYDIQGAYRIEEVDNNLGSGNFGNARALLGLGYFINHARNDLYFTVLNLSHQGSKRLSGLPVKNGVTGDLRNLRHPLRLVWGARVQTERISDRFKEWRYSDSAGYNISPFPQNDSQVNLQESIRSSTEIINNRVSGFFQIQQGLGSVNQASVTAGVRGLWSSLNGQTLISPRFQLYFEPNKRFNTIHKYDSVTLRKNILIKASYGYYYQAPFYREMRGFSGTVNEQLRAQRSIHYTAGTEFGFKKFGRPFKFSAEVFYKDLNYLVPYLLDNIRIRYYAENSARGYAGGFDARVNGEFIKGLESWFSMSILKTDEKIVYTGEDGNILETPFLRRPTDRRLSLAVMFQDELRSNPDYRMHMMLNYGTALPYYLGGANRYKEGFAIPSYRRVDIGFSKVLIGGKATKIQTGFIRHMWIGADVFNLLQINNVIAYLWVKDFSNTTYGVPNYLTGRRLNVRLVAEFR